ncbi:hypothetical protein C1645_882351 [Glomus cerebriforme]|uniref:Uncharacterized protein n=1 Tax=Glomus cerebriforme TaxID=658196 RepID=A0A397S0Z8_9GLOM|nr:hypothetical protein C1645_882351 [Glomus cerebriforme]
MSKYRRSFRLYSLLSPPFISIPNDETELEYESKYKSEYKSEYESEYENEYESEDESVDESKNEQDDRDEVIEIKETVLSACVVIDFVDGKIQRCEWNEGKMRQSCNLFGIYKAPVGSVQFDICQN